MNLCAQTAPTITSQPISQTNLVGSAVRFSVGVSGTGPFTYQWLFNATNLPSNTISTVAGNGNPGFGGDGSAATIAMLNNPSGVAFDANGDLFIADLANNRIRMVNTNGIITTVAGKSGSGYSGDGGAATSASLNGPVRVAFDAHGNFYIADTQNQRIRKVSTNGIITTVAGNGTNGYSGDGGAATNADLHNPVGVVLDASGKLYFADDANSRIRMVNTNGIISTVAGNGTNSYSGDGGLATNAGLYYPNGITFDASGNLHIADASNQRIRKLATNGIINTVAGTGTGGYSGDGGPATNAEFGDPRDVVFDSFGNLYIADNYYGRIRKVATNGIITIVAGKGTSGTGAYSGDGGAATNANLSGSTAMAFDASGNLYIADSDNQRIRKVLLYAEYPSLTLNNLSATNVGNYSVVITSSYGSVTSQVATLTMALPPTVAIQPSSLTNPVGSTASFSVTAGGTGPFTYQWQFNGTNLPSNIIITVAGNGSATYAGDGTAATNASLNLPNAVAFDAVGNLYIADASNNRIRKLDTNGIITTVAGNGTGGFGGDDGAATSAMLNNPSGVAFDVSGGLFIADSANNRIRMVNTNGIITTVAGKSNGGYSGDGGAATNASLNYPSGVAGDSYGNLFVADYYNDRIRKVAINGIITTVAGDGIQTYAGDGGAATNASLFYPSGVALDATGNLFIADYLNNRVRRVSTSGIISTAAGGHLVLGDGGAATNADVTPYGVTFDAFGNLYVADTRLNRIRKVDTHGIITTVAGNGNASYAGDGNGILGYSGDGGAATNASLYYPKGVACDASGNLYIADVYNQRIREVYLAGFPSLTLTNLSGTDAGNYSVVITSPYGSVTSSIAVLYMPPCINVQPQSTSVILGSNANFSVNAAGTEPLNYQWLFAGTNLDGAINAAYAISNVQPTVAGGYSVIVTNSYGSITSSIASLAVTLPAIVPSFAQTNGSSTLGFTWNAIPGLTYQVEYKTNLSQAEWINLGDPIVSTNTAESILDSFGTDSQRFYRVELLQ